MSSATLCRADTAIYADLFGDLTRDFASQLAPPIKCTVSECADDHRILPNTVAEPGPFVTDRVPYLRGVQDAMGDPNIDLVAVMKCSQSCLSEAMRSFIHHAVRQDPGSVLVVFPDEKSVEKSFKKHIIPMIKLSLLDYLKGSINDVSMKHGAVFHNMYLSPAWAGSPQALASDPYRYVLFDEVDKYPYWSGKEGDPVALGTARTRTFGDRGKVVLISTPTVREGKIARAFYGISDRRHFWVPCAKCGHHQHLVWEQVKWPKRAKDADPIEHAEWVEREQLATYACIKCGHEHDDADRLGMVDDGEWRSRLKNTNGSRQVAFHINALYSPWSNLSKLAAKWLKAQVDGLSAVMEFKNQELGLPFEDVTAKVSSKVFAAKKAAGHPGFVVPKWAAHVIATADTQKDGHPYVVRAWGRGFRSRLIDIGHAVDLPMLYDLTVGCHYAIEGTTETLSPTYLLIDSGGGIIDNRDMSSTDKVYQFSLEHEGTVIPIKGHGGKTAARSPMRPSRVTYEPPNKHEAYQITVQILDTEYYKDNLNALVMHKDPKQWEVADIIDDNYVRQMCAEKKIFLPKKRVLRWVNPEGVKNDYWDCEVYQRAAADLIRAGTLPGVDALVEHHKKMEIARVRNETHGRTRSQPRSRYAQKGNRGGRGWVSRR